MPAETENMNVLIGLVRQWGEDKGITGPNGKATAQTQYNKLLEEVSEIGTALDANDQHETVDGIGDATVVLILLAELVGERFEDCLQSAYEVIKQRTGRMVDGIFLKDQ